MNQSKLKLEGNIIGYMCESSLDGWNYFTYNKNKNTIFYLVDNLISKLS